jgi:electron transport complex protein RnfC
MGSGIYLPKHKQLSSQAPILTCSPAAVLMLPLLQHRGQPARLVVKVGDRVAAGQLVGEAQGAISACVHAPADGTIAALETVRLFDGRSAQALRLETDRTVEPTGLGASQDWRAMPPAILLERISAAGVVGLGGAGFPTHRKLTPPEGTVIDVLVVNGAECEPYLNADFRGMLERSRELLEGIKIIQKILGGAKAVIGVEQHAWQPLNRLRALCEAEANVVIRPLPDTYPQGDETLLTRALLGRLIPGPGLPWDAGVAVLNVSTLLAVYEAVVSQQPLVSRVITVAGPGLRHSVNMRVECGTPLAHVLESAGGMLPEAHRIIVGGPMMGHEQNDLATPVIKTTTGILVLTKRDVWQGVKETPCIRCGYCVDACPYRLQPLRLYAAIKKGRHQQARAEHLEYCVECGCCDYVCPAKIPLAGYFRQAKLSVREEKND